LFSVDTVQTPLFQVFTSTFPLCNKFASLLLVLVCVCFFYSCPVLNERFDINTGSSTTKLSPAAHIQWHQLMLQDYTQEFWKKQSNYKAHREGENSLHTVHEDTQWDKTWFCDNIVQLFLCFLCTPKVSWGIVNLNINTGQSQVEKI